MHKQQSLKSTLLWLILPIVILAMITSWLISIHKLKTQVQQAFDRTLAGAIRAIEVNVKTDNGGLSMEQPFYLFELLELTTQSPVYFRVATEDGLTEIGYASIPLPEDMALSHKPVFYDSQYFGENIRIAAIAIHPKIPLLYSPNTRLIIQVAEKSQARTDFINEMLWQSVGKDLFIIVLLIIIIYVGILIALRPLQRLNQRVAQRNDNDLRPIVEDELPSEITPLVEAINIHIDRYAKSIHLQRQFLDDAAHQLRTPLAILNTQISYARSLSHSNQEMDEVLSAAQLRLSNTIELTNQLLTLAKVHNATEIASLSQQQEILNICELTSKTVNDLLPFARRKKIDYGMDIPTKPLYVQGVAWLIQEALNNLIGNAIKYCPKGSQITTSIIEQPETLILQVEDNGPGMNPEDIASAGKRFRRGSAGREQQGSGLGLAIVQTIADINQAQLEFLPSSFMSGLKVRLIFPKKG